MEDLLPFVKDVMEANIDDDDNDVIDPNIENPERVGANSSIINLRIVPQEALDFLNRLEIPEGLEVLSLALEDNEDKSLELEDDKNDVHWDMRSGRTSSRAVDGGGDWCSAGSGVKLEHIIIVRS